MRCFLWLCFGLCATLLGAEGPQRIASYSPGATQTLLDLGCRERIVAATRWCPLPPSHAAARTCDAFNPDLETLRLAKPAAQGARLLADDHQARTRHPTIVVLEDAAAGTR